jgi:peroxiredoxin Q/BCP
MTPAPRTTQVGVGEAAPDFTLTDQRGRQVNLRELLRERCVVLYFYPKDDTPGCTNEAIAFTGLRPEFDKADTVVIGASKGTAKSKAKFRDKHNLGIPLGADPEAQVIEAYDSWVEKSLYGRKYMGIDRATFLIDRDGILRHIWRKVKVPGHAEAVLKAAQDLA